MGAFILFTFQSSGDSNLAGSYEEVDTHEASGQSSKAHFDAIAYMKQAQDEMRQRRMARQIVAESRFSEQEQAKISDAIARKITLRAVLVQEIAELKRAVDDEQSTDQDIAEAVDRLLKARQVVEDELSSIDASLGADLSGRAKARALVTGIVDNGLGILAGKIDPAIMKRQASDRMGDGGDRRPNR
jgi:hypothetical protein